MARLIARAMLITGAAGGVMVLSDLMDIVPGLSYLDSIFLVLGVMILHMFIWMMDHLDD